MSKKQPTRETVECDEIPDDLEYEYVSCRGSTFGCTHKNGQHHFVGSSMLPDGFEVKGYTHKYADGKIESTGVFGRCHRETLGKKDGPHSDTLDGDLIVDHFLSSEREVDIDEEEWVAEVVEAWLKDYEPNQRWSLELRQHLINKAMTMQSSLEQERRRKAIHNVASGHVAPKDRGRIYSALDADEVNRAHSILLGLGRRRKGLERVLRGCGLWRRPHKGGGPSGPRSRA